MVQTFHIKQSQPSNTSSANNAQLAKTILQTTAFICKAGQISTMNSMQNWSDSYCKTVISILNLARTILQTSDQNWSDSIFKPVIPFLNLARTSLQTSLQTSDLQVHSSSSISPYHILVFILDINQAMHYSFFTSHPTLCCSNLEIVFLLQKL